MNPEHRQRSRPCYANLAPGKLPAVLTAKGYKLQAAFILFPSQLWPPAITLRIPGRREERWPFTTPENSKLLQQVKSSPKSTTRGLRPTFSPIAGSDPQAVYQTIHDQLILDGNSQQNLATFCTTWIESEVKQLMDESADKNMIDKDEYPQTAAIEERCVHMLADLWNSPEAASTIGCSTTGSSEAAMLGGLALKWNWRKRRPPKRNQPALRTS